MPGLLVPFRFIGEAGASVSPQVLFPTLVRWSLLTSHPSELRLLGSDAAAIPLAAQPLTPLGLWDPILEEPQHPAQHPAASRGCILGGTVVPKQL